MSASGPRPVLCTFSKTTWLPSGEYRAPAVKSRLQGPSRTRTLPLTTSMVSSVAVPCPLWRSWSGCRRWTGRRETSRGRGATGTGGRSRTGGGLATRGVGDPEVVALAVAHREHELAAVGRPVRVRLVPRTQVVERRGAAGAVGPDQRHLVRVAGVLLEQDPRRGVDGARARVRVAVAQPEHDEARTAVTTRAAAVRLLMGMTGNSRQEAGDFHSQESSISRSSPATALLTPRCP